MHKTLWIAGATTLALTFAAGFGRASSHREAPNITKNPKVDATDFYMFRSYEAGRADYVTIVACYQPLQAPGAGPNYFTLDPDALYEIHVDNDGDAIEDLTFQFRFQNALQDQALTIGPIGNQRTNAIPLVNKGPIPSAADLSNLNVRESYTLTLVRGDRRTGQKTELQNTQTSSTRFAKPVDYIGAKSIPDYPAYAEQHRFDVTLPGGGEGRVFVGQRKDPFVVNLGETFDLVNLDPLGPVDGKNDTLANSNVTAFVLELPISFLTEDSTILGGWTSASLRQARVINPEPLSSAADNKVTVEGGAWTQVSRLGMPLVNEVVIGLKDKDRFNASEPSGDASFLDYVTHPTLPALLGVLFPVTAPTAFPRNDLVAVFLTGVEGLNQPRGVVPSEMLRLNTATAVTAAGAQSNLGVLGSDPAGFPNGRRPGDDVVDCALRVVMGALLAPEDAPSGQLAFTDGASVDATFFDAAFPYLRTPLAGSPDR